MYTRGVFVLSFVLISIALLPLMNSSKVDFFYSPSCIHCQNIFPLIETYEDYFTNWEFSYYDITKGSYAVQGVPTIMLTTSDGREIFLIGSKEIPQKIECELLEMSTPECITYSADECITGSWFKWS